MRINIRIPHYNTYYNNIYNKHNNAHYNTFKDVQNIGLGMI